LEALQDKSQNSFYATTQLTEAYFNVEAYDKVIFYSEKIKEESGFNKSRTQFLYGLALENTGNTEEAENNLRQIDIRYSFYEERLALAKFLLSIKKEDDAKGVLNEISMESQNMSQPNKRIYKAVILEVEKLLKEFDNPT
jgi:hypothetical protein